MSVVPHQNMVGVIKVFIITPSLMTVVNVSVVTVLCAVMNRALSDVLSHLLIPLFYNFVGNLFLIATASRICPLCFIEMQGV